MNLKNLIKKQIYIRLVAGFVLFFVLVYSVWAYYESRYPSWDEEVRLNDGRIITIRQKREYYENYGTTESWVEVNLPELNGKQVWNSYLMPQRVDVLDGKVYAFGIPRGPKQLSHYRYPKYYMVAFVWKNDSFQRIRFLDLPEVLRQEENIYPCVPEDRSKTLSLVIKEKTWCLARGDDNELTKVINLNNYKKAADSMAALSNWTDRSE